MGFEGLDEPCPVCDRPTGDHTLREWSSCLGQTTTDLPMEPVPADLRGPADEALRRMLTLDDDVLIADHVMLRAAVLDTDSGPVKIKLPALVHEFGVGVAGGPPRTVATILYLGDAMALRGYGDLIRDGARNAAAASER